uniref:Ninein (GSK3B interacting protein) n=1 Tax=Salarias fasciatus TaxID=181472 RepID=A0A672I0D9_SALFA
MGDGQEQDQYEERLKELFNSFDASGCGSLSAEELSELCQSLHLDDATPALLHALLQNQDQLTSRVKSPEIQPKFVKGSKRYGRRSTPEYLEPVPDSGLAAFRTPPHTLRILAFACAGQMHLWNPDEPSTPRGSVAPLSPHLQERLREACEELSISWDGCAGRAGHAELLALCEHLGLEINGDVLLSLTADGAMNVEDFVSRVVNQNKPPTPSASTPYRQLKRLHSTQPFDEGGRRIATPSALTGSIGMRLFSTLDDGSGFTPAEYILDAWIEEGVENSAEILQALNFDLDGKLSLGDLTTALENELLVTKNGVHLAALASFKAEIRYLLERVDREIREKEKIRSDLEKAERLKTQFATEVDEHHSAMEHKNSLNLRKLEQEHKEKLAAVRSELMKEMDQIQQQAGLQREELETEIKKIREDESFLREHLSISVKESRRLEMELLDSNEKLVEAQSQISKLQTNLDNIMKDKFGDLDPGSADFLLQEERIKQLRSGYEAQCRELQDRIDELQSELQEFHSLGRAHQSCQKPLSEELESKSPGMESDPGIGSEEVQPFSMSLEAEMMLEQLKEQHLQEMEDLRNQLESKVSPVEPLLFFRDQKAALSLQYQQEFQALQEEMASVQTHAEELQSQLDQAEQEQRRLERRQAEEREELENLQEEEVASLRQQLLEAHHSTADLEEQLKALEAQHAETDEDLHSEMEKLRETHIAEVRSLKDEHAQLLEARLAEERKEFQQERVRLERSLSEDWEKEKKALQQNHELKLEELKLRFDEERDEVVKSLTEQWQKERAQLDEQNSESLQVLLEEEMLRLVRDQEEKESRLKEQWEQERARLQEQHQEALLDRLQEERLQFEQREKKLREEWEEERLQLEEDYEGMIQDRLNEEREKLETEREEEEKRAERLIAEEKELLEERHREAVRELRAKHAEERDALSATLDKLRDDIAQERWVSPLYCFHHFAPELQRCQNEQHSLGLNALCFSLHVKLADESQECVNRQSARLKSDLRVVQQEKDSLKHEVTVLQKQLQNSNDKNHVLEMALHSSGLQNQSKRLYRDEMSRLMEQEQLLLRQENDRLQAEVRSIKDELAQSREKARQLDATIMSLKQHKQQSPSSLLKTLEQENIALKQELEAQRELNKVETYLNDDRERKMKMMEERMKEIELSLHNVKLLLREKAAQLKDQLHKNGKSDVLIKDLYVENSQLLKALEITEQRQKIAEKKNYLLEEKISSLNKIIRDLNPAALPPLPYHYKCS